MFGVDVNELVPPPAAMCDVCKVQLIPISHGQEVDGEGNLMLLVEYRHPPAIGEDHAPEPVRLSDETINRCDFCSAILGDTWTLECTPFTHEDYIDDGAWAACDICVELIRADDWDGMRVRVERLVDLIGGGATIESALGLQAAFRRHFTGEITKA